MVFEKIVFLIFCYLLLGTWKYSKLVIGFVTNHEYSDNKHLHQLEQMLQHVSEFSREKVGTSSSLHIRPFVS